MARRSTKQQIEGHGLGRHTKEEVLQIGERSFKSLSVLLGDKPFFFGEKPCSLDVTAFAMLAGFYLSTLDTPINTMAKKYANLKHYYERIHGEYYS